MTDARRAARDQHRLGFGHGWAGYSGAVTGPRILFVEDEPSIFEPFSKALSREGFEPIVATTVAKAIEIAERIDPDLVLLDLNLPDGDGRDVARALRRDRATLRSSWSPRAGPRPIASWVWSFGADDYVVKPFSGAEVIARIRAVLRRTQRRDRRRWRRWIGGPGDRPVGVARGARRIEARPVAQGVRPAGRAGQPGRAVVTRDDLMAEVWDENWLRRPRRSTCTSAGCGASWATTPPTRATSTPSGGRLPLLRARGVPERLSLRRALLLAFAYVLLLAIVSFGIPLGLALRDRVDSEVLAGAQPGGPRGGDRERPTGAA